MRQSRPKCKIFGQTLYKSLPPAARGALFEKTAPLDPPQKLFIRNFFICLALIFALLNLT
jgi:hypothetical protein